MKIVAFKDFWFASNATRRASELPELGFCEARSLYETYKIEMEQKWLHQMRMRAAA